MTPIEFRRHIHAKPELSFLETQTARFITETLSGIGIASTIIARTGVLVRLEGCGDLRRAVVLRADIDALPITETTGREWASRNEGIMHACGHDIHAAVLYGVLLRLAADRSFEGTVFGLFQPGEECNPGGASMVLAENPFEGYRVEAVVGEHVEPSLEVGTFGFKSGKYMASNDELRFTVRGTGGHAAMRSDINDTVTAAAELTMKLTALNNCDSVVSVGRFIADGATNVIPDSVYMEGTMRSFDEQERLRLMQAIAHITEGIEQKYGVQIDTDINHGYPCVVNNPELTKLATALATEKYKTVKLTLRPTAEDFGFYSMKYPSLFYRLGVGSNSGRTHTSVFDPDERAIDTGIDFMYGLTQKLMKRNE